VILDIVTCLLLQSRSKAHLVLGTLTMKIITHSDTETRQFAREFAQEFSNKGDVITLSGELGAGKTTFVQGFAKGLGIEEKIISPTFVLIRQHLIPNTERFLFHVDLYRLEGTHSLVSLGLDELIQQKKSIVLIEWPERLSDKYIQSLVTIEIKKLKSDLREIEIVKRDK
jgi:tRNA threonylcarbamoyladenosine biosynthesis protein TsaE